MKVDWLYVPKPASDCVSAKEFRVCTAVQMRSTSHFQFVVLTFIIVCSPIFQKMYIKSLLEKGS